MRGVFPFPGLHPGYHMAGLQPANGHAVEEAALTSATGLVRFNSSVLPLPDSRRRHVALAQEGEQEQAQEHAADFAWCVRHG